MGIQPSRVPSVRHHYRRMDRRSLSPSGVGVCDRVACADARSAWLTRAPLGAERALRAPSRLRRLSPCASAPRDARSAVAPSALQRALRARPISKSEVKIWGSGLKTRGARIYESPRAVACSAFPATLTVCQRAPLALTRAPPSRLRRSSGALRARPISKSEVKI